MNGSRTVLAGIALLAGAALLLSGCGFRPVYGGASYDNLRNVSVNVRGEDRFAYLVETALMERLGATDSRRGRLRINMRVRQQNLGVSADGEASRIALVVLARYALDLPGQPSLTGQVSERVAFETPREPYALISARANAERQAAETMAETILRTVSADLRRRELAPTRPSTHPDQPHADPLEEFPDELDELDDLLGEDDGW